MLQLCKYIMNHYPTSSSSYLDIRDMPISDFPKFCSLMGTTQKKCPIKVQKKYLLKVGVQYFITWEPPLGAGTDIIRLNCTLFLSSWGDNPQYQSMPSTMTTIPGYLVPSSRSADLGLLLTRNPRESVVQRLRREKKEGKVDSLTMEFEQCDMNGNIKFEDMIEADNPNAITGVVESSSISTTIRTYQGISSAYDYFFGHNNAPKMATTKKTLIGNQVFSEAYSEVNCGFLGSYSPLINADRYIDDDDGEEEDKGKYDEHLYLNVQEPFCLVCVGIQGAGKSHSMNVVLENCFINYPHPSVLPVTRLKQSTCGLVLHYDQSPGNICEVTGLRRLTTDFDHAPEIRPVENMIILVSATYYKQRKAFYENVDVKIYPLLFKWSSLGAQQLKKLMRLSENDAQLYVSVILNLLRQYQRDGRLPVFKSFLREVLEKCDVQGQNGPLKQRLQLLETIIMESEWNKDFTDVPTLESMMGPNVLIVADLTDPLLSASEANGIFQVLLEQFRSIPIKDGTGKVVAFDEAHKYLAPDGSSAKDELSSAIVNSVRLMRHEGLRILISTQSPMALPSELLELISVAMLHHFQSNDWYKYLASKIPLPDDSFEEIKKLQVGEALCISTKIDSERHPQHYIEDSCVKISIRRRITADYGKSKTNKVR